MYQKFNEDHPFIDYEVEQVRIDYEVAIKRAMLNDERGMSFLEIERAINYRGWRSNLKKALEEMAKEGIIYEHPHNHLYLAKDFYEKKAKVNKKSLGDKFVDWAVPFINFIRR